MRIINLLPKAEQTLIKQEKILSTGRRGVIYAYLTYGLLLLILIGTRIYMQQNLPKLDSLIQRDQDILSKQDNTNFKNAINLDNATINDYLTLAARNPTWSKVLEQFAKDVPPGVEVQNLNASTSNGKIAITGTAETRDAVLQLRRNIIADPLFENIDLPLDNLQQPTNLQYHYTFFVKIGQLSAVPNSIPPPPPPVSKPTAPAAGGDQ